MTPNSTFGIKKHGVLSKGCKVFTEEKIQEIRHQMIEHQQEKSEIFDIMYEHFHDLLDFAELAFVKGFERRERKSLQFFIVLKM